MTGKLETVQFGRGLAAVAVAAFHLSLSMAEPRYGGVAVFRGLTARGELGVDFFFVLSGFVIMHAHGADIGRPDRFGAYAWRRLVRVFPVYWLYSLAFLAVTALHLSAEARPPADLTAWVNSFALIRISAAAPILAPAWTLFHEVAFYAAFGLLILRPRFGPAVLAVWMAACALMLEWPAPAIRAPLQVYFAAFNLNFAVGMAAALVYRRAGRSLWPPIAGAAVLVAAVILDTDRIEASRLVYAAAFGLIIAGAGGLERRGLRLPAGLLLLGDASYTLYLTHEPAQAFVLKLAEAAGLRGIIGREGVYAIALSVAVGAGVLAYLAIERPLIAALRAAARAGIDRELARRRRPARAV